MTTSPTVCWPHWLELMTKKKPCTEEDVLLTIRLLLAGAIVVSGLSQETDHALVVESIRKFSGQGQSPQK